MDILFVLGRILLGGYFIMNGVQHFTKKEMLTGYAALRGAYKPKAATLLSGVFLLLGGAGILLGVFIEWAVAFIAVFLVIVLFQIHHFWTDEDPSQKMNERIAFMKNLALLGAVLMLLAIPTPWAFSLGF